MVEFKEDRANIDIMEDLDFTKRLNNTFGKDFLKALKSSDAVLAGGAMTSYFSGSEINDFDIYFESKEKFKQFIFELPDNFNAQYFLTDKSMTMKSDGITIQFIIYKFHPKDGDHDYYQTSVCESIFKSFDFTINMCAYSFKSATIVFHTDFFKHLGQRKLMFWKGTDYPLVSALRLDKYALRGYKVPLSEKLKVFSEVSKLGLSSPDKLIDHIGSMYGLKVKKLKQDIETKLSEGWEFDPTEAIDLVVKNCKLESTYNLVSQEWVNHIAWKSFQDMIREVKKAKNKEYIIADRYDKVSKDEYADKDCVFFSMVDSETGKDQTEIKWGENSWNIKSSSFWEEILLFVPENEVSFEYLQMIDTECKNVLYKLRKFYNPDFNNKEDVVGSTSKTSIPF